MALFTFVVICWFQGSNIVIVMFNSMIYVMCTNFYLSLVDVIWLIDFPSDVVGYLVYEACWGLLCFQSRWLFPMGRLICPLMSETCFHLLELFVSYLKVSCLFRWLLNHRQHNLSVGGDVDVVNCHTPYWYPRKVCILDSFCVLFCLDLRLC